MMPLNFLHGELYGKGELFLLIMSVIPTAGDMMYSLRPVFLERRGPPARIDQMTDFDGSMNLRAETGRPERIDTK